MSTLSKQQLIQEVMQSGEQVGVESVAFHAVASDKIGLHASSMKTIGLLHQHGPQTAGDIAKHTGLTPGAVTTIIDLLIAKGFVHRRRDSADRRKVRIELTSSKEHEINTLYKPMVEAMEQLLSTFNTSELQVILAYQKKTAALMHEQAQALQITPRNPST